MKILILTPIDHFHSPIVIRALGQSRPNDEIVVVTTPKLPGSGGFFSRMSRLVKQSGWDYLLSMFTTKLCFSILRIIEWLARTDFRKRSYLTVTDVIKHFRFRHYHFKNINHRKNLSLLQSIKPEIILVLFFNQIIKEPIRRIPNSGCVNLHPSYLPAYRGISPCFWVLANLPRRPAYRQGRQAGNKNQAGVSLHHITEEIDTGSIIRQAKVAIHSSDSFFNLYRRCAETGAGLLEDIPGLLRRKLEVIQQKETQASYFGLITPSAVRRFRRNQRRFAWFI